MKRRTKFTLTIWTSSLGNTYRLKIQRALGDAVTIVEAHQLFEDRRSKRVPSMEFTAPLAQMPSLPPETVHEINRLLPAS